MKKVVEDPYIWQVSNSLTDEFCDKLVQKFEEDSEGKAYRGIVGSGVQTEIKETLDLAVSPSSEVWKKDDEFISNKIGECINEYIEYITKCIPNVDFHNGIRNVTDSGYHIQRYEANKGFYTWHNDYSFEKDKIAQACSTSPFAIPSRRASRLTTARISSSN